MSIDYQVCAKLCMHLHRFRPRIRFICERSAENETMQRFRFGFDVLCETVHIVHIYGRYSLYDSVLLHTMINFEKKSLARS